jgi:hypothetical protein
MIGSLGGGEISDAEGTTISLLHTLQIMGQPACRIATDSVFRQRRQRK